MPYLSNLIMKRLLFTLFILSVTCFFSNAQMSFIRVDTVQVIDQTLPLKNAWAGGLNHPLFSEIDLNGDSIMDLVAFDLGGPPGNYRLMPFINHGDSGKIDYHYAPEYISRFPPLNQWMVTYDYNHDGKWICLHYGIPAAPACQCIAMISTQRKGWNLQEWKKNLAIIPAAFTVLISGQPGFRSCHDRYGCRWRYGYSWLAYRRFQLPGVL